MPTESGLTFESRSEATESVGSDKLADFFFPLYERLINSEGDFVGTVEQKLSEACRDVPVELYLSRAIGYGAITGTLLWASTTFTLWVVFTLLGVDLGTIIGLPVQNEALRQFVIAIRIPLLIVVSGVVLGTIGALLGFFSPVIWLYFDSSEREREINMLLPDAVAFMYALSIGGMNQLDILDSVAKADDVYGEISTEFEIILQETRYFGVDYRTAIRNRSLETPSSEFSQFLTDMLSILSSGGDMAQFLDEQKDKFIRTATKQQEKTLESLELFGEMYMTLSVFPILLLILLVVLQMMGNATENLIMGTVYGLIPITGVIFIVLISTVKKDDPGDGYLIPEEGDPYIDSETSALGVGVIERFTAPYSILDRIRKGEETYKTKSILKSPQSFFLEHPNYTFAITIPLTIVLMVLFAIYGAIPLSYEEWQTNVVGYTVMLIYFPVYLLAIPYAITYELKERRRNQVTKKLSGNLRKLASANDTGQTLLKSFETVSQTSKGKLSHEFEIIHNKVKYGISMKQALIEFNNKYHLPRLARTMKLIAKAQETSSQITPVLKTAAAASEQQDDLAEERKTRSRMQIAIIIMTYLTLLAVMAILQVQFIETMAELTEATGGGGGGQEGPGGFDGIDVDKLSLLFFHAVTLQAIVSSMVSGYMRTGQLQSGVKYLLALPTISLLVWIAIT